MTLDYDRYLTDESARFLEAVTAAPPDARVPACPDWDAGDLLWHLGTVQHFWAEVLRMRPAPPADYDEPARPQGREALVAFYRDASAALQAGLRAAGDDEAAWSWHADPALHTVGFIRRRQAHEALIHRLDAEQTAGQVTALPADLASDGVLECLEWMYAGTPDWGTFIPADGRVAVVAEDTGLRTVVRLGRFTGTDPRNGTAHDEDDLAVLTGEAAAGGTEASVAGRAADLDAWLWHRGDGAGLSRSGDPDLLARLEAILAQSID